MKIALIGFGEVGQILGADLTAHELSAWDVLFSDPQSKPSRALAGSTVRAGRNAPDAVAGADLVISAVTAANDMEAARAAAPGMKAAAFFVDFNSASPGMKQGSADLIEAAGGRYVEGAVMTPFPPKRLASSILLGGPHAADFFSVAQDIGLTSTRVFSERLGAASATKMCRSVMIKGVEALCTESMLAARHYGVEDDVLNSLSDLLPVGDWRALARYMISRSLEHGVRRAEEMREAARTVEEAGVEPLMSRAIAQRQDWAAGRGGDIGYDDLAVMLDAVLGDKDDH